MPNVLCSHKTLNLDNSSEKRNFKQIFLIPNSTLHEFFNDTTHIFFLKKNAFEYLVPHPHKWGRNNKIFFFWVNTHNVV